MKEQIISEIIRNMLPHLDNAQLKQLQDTLQYCFWNIEVRAIDTKEKPKEKLTNEEGDLSIDASNIVQDATHRFLTDVQISNLQEKVSIIETTITINPEDVSGSVAPYSCVKTLSGADPSYPAPLVDIAYTNDVFEDNEAEEEEWYKLHRCIINQANQVTITFKEKPTRAFQMRFQIKVPGI